MYSASRLARVIRVLVSSEVGWRTKRICGHRAGYRRGIKGRPITAARSAGLYSDTISREGRCRHPVSPSHFGWKAEEGQDSSRNNGA